MPPAQMLSTVLLEDNSIGATSAASLNLDGSCHVASSGSIGFKPSSGDLIVDYPPEGHGQF